MLRTALLNALLVLASVAPARAEPPGTAATATADALDELANRYWSHGRNVMYAG